MRFPGWFAILVGVVMLGQWSLFLASGNVPELKTEPIRIYFHLAGELLTAVLLIVSGAGALRSLRWGRPLLLVALGMLLYTSIVSPGYFAQRGEVEFLAMFGLILAMTVAAIVSLLSHGGEG